MRLFSWSCAGGPGIARRSAWAKRFLLPRRKDFASSPVHAARGTAWDVQVVAEVAGEKCEVKSSRRDVTLASSGPSANPARARNNIPEHHQPLYLRKPLTN